MESISITANKEKRENFSIFLEPTIQNSENKYCGRLEIDYSSIMSATQKFEIDAATARIVLEKLDWEIREKTQACEELASQIQAMEKAKNSLRDQLNGKKEDAPRASTGDNRARIKDYLLKNASRMVQGSEIAKATGIGNSSVAYTLKAYSSDFVQDKPSKLWKLKVENPANTLL